MVLCFPLCKHEFISWEQPQRGDIVVFQGPESENSLTLIKRVVGIPGDKVTFTNGILTINGVLAKQEFQPESNHGKSGWRETGENYNLFFRVRF